MSEWREIQLTEWWCPTTKHWRSCEGPCPDGTPHGPKRQQTLKAEVVKGLDFPADGTPLAAAMDRLQEAKRKAHRIWNHR
jgi:hypothetical protein